MCQKTNTEGDIWKDNWPLQGGPICSRHSAHAAVMYLALLQRAEDHKVVRTFLSPNKVSDGHVMSSHHKYIT